MIVWVVMDQVGLYLIKMFLSTKQASVLVKLLKV